jgi:hypothetical protein
MIAEEDTFNFWRIGMKKPVTAVFLWVIALCGQNIKTGPNAGQAVPAFSAQDQDARTQTLQSVTGPKGAMLVFFRSADW